MLPKDLLGQTYRLTFKVPETAGVYFIYCEANGKAYIGSTVRIYSRLYGHHAQLKRKRHPNPHMQAAYNLYGRATFKYLTLETTENKDPQHLLDRENHYMAMVDRDMLFNIAVPAVLGGPVGIKRSPEHRQAISRAQTGNKWALGMHHTDEWRAAISLRFKGKKHTPEQIARAVAGRRAAFEANPTMSQGEKNGRAKLTAERVRELRKLYAEGNHTQTALAELFGVDQTVVSKVVLRKSWRHLDD